MRGGDKEKIREGEKGRGEERERERGGGGGRKEERIGRRLMVGGLGEREAVLKSTVKRQLLIINIICAVRVPTVLYSVVPFMSKYTHTQH